MSEATTSITNATSDTTKTITIEATTGEAMHELGKHVARLTHGGDIIPSPPLRRRKTTFAQGFGAGLNISEPIVSPTFTIARELEGQFPTATLPTSYTSTSLTPAATPTPQAKTLSNDYLTNSNH